MYLASPQVGIPPVHSHIIGGCYDPVSWFTGSCASQVGSHILAMIINSLVNMFGMLVSSLASLIVTALAKATTSSGLAGSLPASFSLSAPNSPIHAMLGPAGVVAFVVIVIGVVDAIVKHSPVDVVKRAFILPIIAGILVTAIYPMMNLAIGLVAWMGETFDNQAGGWGVAAAGFSHGLSSALTGMVNGSSIMSVITLLLAIFLMIGIFIEMAIRNSLLNIIAIFFPLMLGGMFFPPLQHWVRKLAEVTLAILFTPLLVTVLLGLASQYITGNQTMYTAPNVLGCLFLATLGLPILLKLVPITLHAAATHMGAGHRAIASAGRHAAKSGADVLSAPMGAGSIVKGASGAGGAGAGGALGGLGALGGPIALGAMAAKTAANHAQASVGAMASPGTDTSASQATSQMSGGSSQTKKGKDPIASSASGSPGGSSSLSSTPSPAKTTQQTSSTTAKPTPPAPKILSGAVSAMASGGVAGVAGHIGGHIIGSALRSSGGSNSSSTQKTQRNESVSTSSGGTSGRGGPSSQAVSNLPTTPVAEPSAKPATHIPAAQAGQFSASLPHDISPQKEAVASNTEQGEPAGNSHLDRVLNGFLGANGSGNGSRNQDLLRQDSSPVDLLDQGDNQ